MVNNKLRILAVLLVAILCLGCSANKKSSAQGKDVPLETTYARSAQAEAGLDGTQKSPEQQAAIVQPAQERTSTDGASSETKQTLPGGNVRVEIDTFKVFSDEVSLRDARARTLQFVRELALEKALPVDVSITGLTTDIYVERNSRFDESTAKSIFLMSSSAGRFASEDILEAFPVFDRGSHSLRYQLRYRAEIIPQPKTYNQALNLRVSLSKSLLSDGERFDISINANEDGWLYLFNFLPDNSVALVYPTYVFPDNWLRKGQPWKQQIAGRIPPGQDYSIETLYVVFSLDPIAGWEDFKSNVNANDLVFSAGEESFILFQKWLGRSDPARRVEKLAQIHIVK